MLLHLLAAVFLLSIYGESLPSPVGEQLSQMCFSFGA
jgi:hypothetical protein